MQKQHGNLPPSPQSIEKNICQLFLLPSPVFKPSIERLRLDEAVRDQAHIFGFNSIMVRLRQVVKAKFVLTPVFQFQYGAIKTGIGNHDAGLRQKFQFQYGAIKTTTPVKFKTDLGCFNSNMVRLRRACVLSRATMRWRFNSTMVRLRLQVRTCLGVSWLFQFQYGAIKTCLGTCTAQDVVRFNSNMVRLRLILRTTIFCTLICFNSNMVRLRQASGTMMQVYCKSFNSNMVRLRL